MLRTLETIQALIMMLRAHAADEVDKATAQIQNGMTADTDIEIILAPLSALCVCVCVANENTELQHKNRTISNDQKTDNQQRSMIKRTIINRATKTIRNRTSTR